MESVILTIGNNNMKLRSRLRSNNTLNKNNETTIFNRTNSKRRRQNSNLIIQKNRNNNNNKKKSNNTCEIIVKTCSFLAVGNLTSEVYEAWCSRIGPTTDLQAPEELLVPLFNDVQLYPTDAQVNEMVSLIRQCSRIPSTSNFLTFGEVCLLTAELRRVHRSTLSADSIGDVFLGGSCGNTTWRTEIAIPILKSAGVSFYNPQVEIWKPELIIAEQRAKQNAKILLFVVDGETRCAAGMLEMAQLAAQKSDRLIAVLPEFSQNRQVAGENLDLDESIELCSARDELVRILENKNIKVHTEIQGALEECLRLINREPTIILEKLRTEYEKFCLNGGLTLPDACAVCYRLTGRLLTVNELRTVLKASNRGNPRDVLLDYDQLCTLVAEITSQNNIQMKNLENGYDNHKAEDLKKFDIFLTKNIDMTNFDTKNTNFSFTNDYGEIDFSKKKLFYISETSRNSIEMILASFWIALDGQNSILCIKNIEKSSGMSLQAINDYNRARSYLKDLAVRENCTVFDDLDLCLKMTLNSLK